MILATKRFLILAITVVILVCFFSRTFSGGLLLPQSFSLGFLTIHYYGLIMAFAVAGAFYLGMKRAPKYGIEKKLAEDLMFWLIIGGFIGARLYHVASSFGYYRYHFLDIFKVWNGGLSIYGALLGGVIALYVVSKFLNPKSLILNLLDWLTPSLIIGQIIGRFGNLFNYEAFGYPTNLPWKMFVPEQFRPEGFQAVAFFHPWFLYEQLGSLIILILLLKWLKPTAPGRLFFSYVLLYNVVRFFLEFLRIDSTFIGIWRLNAAVSLGLVLMSIGCLIYFRKIKVVYE